MARRPTLIRIFAPLSPSFFFTLSPTSGVLAKMSVLSAGGGNDSFVQMLLACKTKGQLRFSYLAAQLIPRRGSCNRVPGCLRVLSGTGASFSLGFAAPTVSPSLLFPVALVRVTLSFSRRIILCRRTATRPGWRLAARQPLRVANFRGNQPIITKKHECLKFLHYTAFFPPSCFLSLFSQARDRVTRRCCVLQTLLVNDLTAAQNRKHILVLISVDLNYRNIIS